MAQDDTTHYETVIILRQDLSNAQAQEFVDKTKKELLNAKADISREESWGLRNLSYPIRKNKKGHYFLINHSNSSKITQEMERVLRLNENLLRLLTIRTEVPVNEPSSMTIQTQNENLDEGARAHDRSAHRTQRPYGERYNNNERDTQRTPRQYGGSGGGGGKYNNDNLDAERNAPQNETKEPTGSEAQSRDDKQTQLKDQE